MISLIKVNPKGIRHSNIPYSLLYLATSLKNAGFDAEIIDCSEDEISTVARKVADEVPLFVGLSVFTGTPTKLAADMSKEIKNKIDVPIVWGGVHPSLLPEQCLQENYIDMVIIGEGEETIVELSKAMKRGGNLKKIRGIGYKEHGKKIITEPRPLIKNLDKYRIDWSLIDLKPYISHTYLPGSKRILSYITSRGCPHNCAFCYNIKFNKRFWRPFSSDIVLSDIEFFKSQYNVDGIYFFDDNLFVDKKRIMKITESIELPWYGEARIDIISKELVSSLQKTHCRKLLFGTESGSNRVLKIMKKGFEVKDILNAARILSETDIMPSHSFILGVPGETWDETQMTVNLILRLSKIDRKSTFTVGRYLPYPSSELYDKAISMGWEPPSRTEDWDILDRWVDKFEIAWLPFKPDFTNVRKYSELLELRSIGPLKLLAMLAEFRLKRRWFAIPIELKIKKWLYGEHDKVYEKPNRLYGIIRKSYYKTKGGNR